MDVMDLVDVTFFLCFDSIFLVMFCHVLYSHILIGLETFHVFSPLCILVRCFHLEVPVVVMVLAPGAVLMPWSNSTEIPKNHSTNSSVIECPL